MLSRSFTAAIASLLVASTGAAPVQDNGLLVNTTSGMVQGIFNSSAPDVRQFLGIPYAEPPIGDLRFAYPVAFNGTQVDATICVLTYALSKLALITFVS